MELSDRVESTKSDTGMGVLSSIRMRFKEALCMDDAMNPTTRIWLAMLDYLQSLSGDQHQHFYWGKMNEHPDEVELLIPWDGVQAWKRFHDSLGTVLAIGVLADAPTYRLMRFPSGDIGGHGRLTEMRTYHLAEAAAQTARDAVQKDWARIQSALQGTPCVASQAAWLESEESLLGAPKRSARGPDNVYVAFLIWPDQHGHDGLASLEKENATIKELSDGLTKQAVRGMKSDTVRLTEQQGSPRPSEQPIMSLAPESLSQLVKTESWPQPHESKRDGWISSLAGGLPVFFKLRPGLGATDFPTPLSGHIPMRDLSLEYRGSLQDGNTPLTKAQSTVIDVIHLTFESGFTDQLRQDGSPADSQAPQGPAAVAWHAWRRDLAGQHGVRWLAWAIAELPADTVTALICWEDVEARNAAPNITRGVPKELQRHLSGDLKAYRLPSVKGAYLPRILGPSEIVCFHIPSSGDYRASFEYYFEGFAGTFEINGLGGLYPPVAGRVLGGGWHEGTVTRDGQQAHVFVAFISWQNSAARAQWYQDYAAGSYEGLGWRVDGLKAMAALGVESCCLKVRPDKPAHYARRPEGGFAEGGGVTTPRPQAPAQTYSIPGGVL